MTSYFYLLVAFALPLSVSDRQYVGAIESSTEQFEFTKALSPVAEKPLVKKAIDSVSTLSEVISETPLLTDGSETLGSEGGTIVWVRMSKAYMADHFEREVNRKKPVRDNILGTSITGESRTIGESRFVLHSNDSNALGEVIFEGEVHCRTAGRNGPATFRYLTNSTFRARKQLAMGDDGLTTSPATAKAASRTTTTDVGSSKPRLRGRIVERIASRRDADSKPQANAITSDHTADDIRHGLDRELNNCVADIQQKLKTQIAAFELDGPEEPMVVRSRSTPEFVEVALCRKAENTNRIKMPAFAVEGNPDLAVRVHRTVLARVLSDRELRQKLAPMLGDALYSQVVASGDSSSSNAPQVNLDKWSMNGAWLALDFKTTIEQDSFLLVALDENLRALGLK